MAERKNVARKFTSLKANKRQSAVAKAALLPFAGVSVLAGVSQLEAAAIPYTNNFSGTGSNTAFPVETPDAKWTVTSGVYRFATNSTTNEASATTLPITNAAGANFTMQTQFTLTSAGNLNAAAQTLGFGLYGLTTALSGAAASSAYYLADFSYGDGGAAAAEGVLRILSLGESVGFTGTTTIVDNNLASSTLAVVPGTTYTLKLQANYVGSTLNMTLGLYDASGTTQIGTSATGTDTSPLTGTNFGYRNRHSISGSNISMDFDNFSIAIPEPGSAGLIGLASAGLLMGRRRRA